MERNLSNQRIVSKPSSHYSQKRPRNASEKQALLRWKKDRNGRKIGTIKNIKNFKRYLLQKEKASAFTAFSFCSENSKNNVQVSFLNDKSNNQT